MLIQLQIQNGGNGLQEISLNPRVYEYYGWNDLDIAFVNYKIYKRSGEFNLYSEILIGALKRHRFSIIEWWGVNVCNKLLSIALSVIGSRSPGEALT
mgnify:CR=1 FL=1